jgi:hypothetical protein
MDHIPLVFMATTLSPRPPCVHIWLKEKPMIEIMLTNSKIFAKRKVNLNLAICLTQDRMVKMKMMMNPYVQMFQRSMKSARDVVDKSFVSASTYSWVLPPK